MGRAVADRLGTAFPYGTLLVNLLGAFLVGVLLTLVTEHVLTDPFWRQLTVVGFLGGFTTFSAYTFETVALLEGGRWGAGLGYVAVRRGCPPRSILVHQHADRSEEPGDGLAREDKRRGADRVQVRRQRIGDH